jgi:hypothetical protein
MKRLISLAAVAVVLTICASADSSDYHAADNPGSSGYFDAQGDNGNWLVGYTGGIGQSKDEVAKFALQRAAEFTAEQHKEWFAVINTVARRIKVGDVDDLTARAGHFMGTAGAAGSPGTASNGGSNGASGYSGQGSSVPSSVLEHWAPRRVYQTILTIQMGSGDQASFKGLDRQPQIFPAAKPAAH